jgi:adenylate cyclase
MNIRILVIDDSKTIRLMVNRVLSSDEEYHFICRETEDGEQAIRYLCACEQEELPDVIILDRNMPNMTGDECIQILKFDEIWQLIPVLFLTAQGDKKEIVKGLSTLQADDYLPKPFDTGEMLARIKVLVRIKLAEDKNRELNKYLMDSNKSLEKANKFIRNTFGRYLSDEIVDAILESPDGLALGGEKRIVTIMMSDLRGFTGISETLPAESIVNIINIYLESMTEIILKYHGTIDEFIGDSILTIFGAPIQREDDAQRAVACALEMQLAMDKVNKINQELDYPEIEMGIGINTGELVVGNIGSQQRTKYGVVGHNVNLTSRIESYTVGGQIFISESTLESCGSILCICDQIHVKPKGVKMPVVITEVSGIGGKFNIFLPDKENIELISLEKPLNIQFSIVVDKDASNRLYEGKILKLMAKIAEIQSTVEVEKFTNLKIVLTDTGYGINGGFYAKVIEILQKEPARFKIIFTSIPSDAIHFLEKYTASQYEY